MKYIQLGERGFFLFLLAVVGCSVAVIHLDDAIWNDELYTLRYFVFVPLETTLWDYHVPNNHILFSLLMKGYFWLMQVVSIREVIENPILARIPFLLFAGGTLMFFWRTTAYFFESIGWRRIALLLLISNAVFGNFIFQFRGYGLSMFLLTFLFWGMCRIHFRNDGAYLNYLGLLIGAMAAFYTVPSNLYFIIAMGIFPAAFYLVKEGFKVPFFGSAAFRGGLALLGGILLGLALYMPIWQAVFQNEYVTNAAPFAEENFERFLKVILGFSSLHFLPILLGIFLLVRMAIKRALNIPGRYLFPILVLILPVIFSFLHGDLPPGRVYAVVLPVFIILLTGCFKLITEQIGWLKTKPIFILIPVYLTLHFALSEVFISNRLGRDNEMGRRNHSLVYQYHNYHFNLHRIIDIIRDDDPELPVYCKAPVDGLDLLFATYGIPLYIEEPVNIQAEGYYFITIDPDLEFPHGYEGKLISSGRNYFKIFKLIRIK